jgi:long-subunit acyl-CoA synthetase (AMP-forming)
MFMPHVKPDIIDVHKAAVRLAAAFAGWLLVDAACAAYSMTSVPLYDTLGPDAVTYICGHAELTAVACSIDVLDTLLKCLPECPTVKIVVSHRAKAALHITSALPKCICVHK